MNTDYNTNNDDVRGELTSALLRLHEERCRREAADRERDKLQAQVAMLQDIVMRGLAAGHIKIQS